MSRKTPGQNLSEENLSSLLYGFHVSLFSSSLAFQPASSIWIGSSDRQEQHTEMLRAGLAIPAQERLYSLVEKTFQLSGDEARLPPCADSF